MYEKTRNNRRNDIVDRAKKNMDNCVSDEQFLSNGVEWTGLVQCGEQ